jgi:hypothetical protein
VVLVTEDVGQHREAVAFLDEAHGHAGHVRLQRHAGVHHRRQPPQTEAIDDEPFDSVISDTTRMVYGKSSFDGSTALERALGQVAVADLATLRAAHIGRFAGEKGGNVVVQQEVLPTSPARPSMRCSSRRCPAWRSPGPASRRG